MSLNLQRYTDTELTDFAQTMGVSVESLRKFEKKREWHILWEHDYIKEKGVVLIKQR